MPLLKHQLTATHGPGGGMGEGGHKLKHLLQSKHELIVFSPSYHGSLTVISSSINCQKNSLTQVYTRIFFSFIHLRFMLLFQHNVCFNIFPDVMQKNGLKQNISIFFLPQELVRLFFPKVFNSVTKFLAAKFNFSLRSLDLNAICAF